MDNLPPVAYAQLRRSLRAADSLLVLLRVNRVNCKPSLSFFTLVVFQAPQKVSRHRFLLPHPPGSCHWPAVHVLGILGRQCPYRCYAQASVYSLRCDLNYLSTIVQRNAPI